MTATNTADIQAKVAAAAASIAGGFSSSATAAAVGVALAFNYIGYGGSVTTLSANPLKTEARIRNSVVNGRSVAVTANSAMQIDALTVAVAAAVGLAPSGSSIAFAGGGVFVQNRIAGDTVAAIDGGTTGSSDIDAELVGRAQRNGHQQRSHQFDRGVGGADGIVFGHHRL